MGVYCMTFFILTVATQTLDVPIRFVIIVKQLYHMDYLSSCSFTRTVCQLCAKPLACLEMCWTLRRIYRLGRLDELDWAVAIDNATISSLTESLWINSEGNGHWEGPIRIGEDVVHAALKRCRVFPCFLRIWSCLNALLGVMKGNGCPGSTF